MEVILAESAGFCWGVERAIDIARDFAVNKQQKVYTDGPLIHNSQMMEKLEGEGISEVGDYQSQADIHIQEKQDAVMVVRAHGISPQRREYLKSLDMQFKDATCPDVGIIAGKIKLHAKKGYTTVIFGDPKHPEVIGLKGYTEENKGFVIQNAEDIESLPPLGDKVCMVSQSTMFVHEFKELAELLKQKYPEVLIFDTICMATKERQSDVIALKQKGVKAFVVIGGKHSANTMKLVKLAEAQNLPTFHIQTAAELDLDVMRRYNPIGITAGASTPDFVIQETAKVLRELEPLEAIRSC